MRRRFFQPFSVAIFSVASCCCIGQCSAFQTELTASPAVPWTVATSNLPQWNDEPANYDATDSSAPQSVIQKAAEPTVDGKPAVAPDADKKAAEEAEKKKKELAKAVAGAYKDTFFDNNFAYLFNPDYTDWHLGENLKQLCAPVGVVDFGGQTRLRYHDEQNMRGLGLTGRDDDFLLYRTRLYANWKINSKWRVFSEFLYADSIDEMFAPRGIEVQNFEPQNLFIERQLWESCGDTLKARVGRQEISLGSQRLLSTLDWANTRQTFDGVRFTLDNKHITSDVLWIRPVKHSFTEFDSSSLDKQVYGIFNTHKNFTPVKLDSYWLALEDASTDLSVHTLGGRVQTERDSLMTDLEGGVQVGRNPDGSSATNAAVTAGSGIKLSDQCWKPVLWAYYDWASGDDSTGNGWNQLFPLAHKYLGFMDFYGRRNINDANLLYTVQPNEKLTLLAWYHYFWLANGNDGPYNAPLTPFNPGGTVGSTDLGQEIDLLATYKLSIRSDVVFGYSHFFAGDYYETSTNAVAAPLFSGDADFYYIQWHRNF